MKKVLIATNNKGKYEEIEAILREQGLTAISPSELGISIDVEETGSTLEENASLKARAFAALAPEYPVIADDTGLEIEALNNEPGIHVRRWKDKKTALADDEIINYCLERLSGVPKESRNARFRTVVALWMPSQGIEFFDGTTEGSILEKPEAIRVPGLPFESLFFVKELSLVLHEAKKQAKSTNHLTHRHKAILKTAKRLKGLESEKNR